MMKYRLTRRGKWVLCALGFALMILSFVASPLVSHYHDWLKQAVRPAQNPQPEDVAKNTLAKHLVASVFFQPDQAEIVLTQSLALDSFLRGAQTLSDYSIVVEGNCADVTAIQPPVISPLDSHQLSFRRAEAVAQYLESKGIPTYRITLIANGSDKPSKDNGTLDGQAFNRRADVYFAGKGTD